MRTVDRLRMQAPAGRVFAAASQVERWPEILAHYRWVKLLERRNGSALVEMAAWRPFGPLRYPTWWRSEMVIDLPALEIRYRHVAGVTKGMDVVWRLVREGDATDVTIVHEWDGPAWPVISWPAANWIIGPVFVHGIASLTLAGIARHTEGQEHATAYSAL